MRVLMFGWEFPPHISGGLGTACHGLTRGLHSLGDVEVLFVIPKAYGNETSDTVELIGANTVDLGSRKKDYRKYLEKIHFIEVESNLRAYATPEEYHKTAEEYKTLDKQVELIDTRLGRTLDFQGGYGGNLYQEIANYAVVAGVLAKKYDFDVIHCHDWLTFPAGIAARNASGKPLVIHVHATDFDRSGGSVNPGVYNIERQGIEASDCIVAVSNLTRNTLIQNYGADPAKVHTVYNAVEPINREAIKAKKGITDKIVTFLGRVTLQKGPGYFIEAAHKVLQKTSDVSFVMAGSGEMLNQMVQRVAQLRIGDKFHFTGFLKGDEVLELYEMSDVYVMPSVSEPFGISPLEAMQSNVPVIISKQSGVAEVLHHAVKVDFWDIDAIADAIYSIISYQGLSSHFRAHGKSEVENLRWEQSAARVRDLYSKLISQ
ncbi:MAG: glycosyltransferase family 4 protein [Bacteroidota bacterium]|nr:MAG: glycosyltransferase family 4 protein [Bacteroidota bacterium]